MIIHIRAPKNVAYVLVTPVYDGEWSDAYVSGAAGLDSEDSDNKGNFTDMDNELTEIQATGVYSLDITQAEMNVDLKAIKMTSSTTGANIPLFVIHTFTPTEDITLAEVAQGQPSATPSLRNALMLLYMALRNDLVESSSLMEITNDAGTVIAKATMSDAAGDFTKAKLVSGP